MFLSICLTILRRLRIVCLVLAMGQFAHADAMFKCTDAQGESSCDAYMCDCLRKECSTHFPFGAVDIHYRQCIFSCDLDKTGRCSMK